jgi:hypothetical protein
MKHYIKRLIAAALTTIATTVAASAATTVYYETYATGLNMGTQNVAVLTATQNGSNVDFALQNTVTGQPSGAFISGISFTYGGTLPTTVTQLAGSQAGITGIGNQGLSGGGVSFNLGIQIDNKGSGNRLLVGETALFRLSNVQLALFDFSPFKGGIHIQGLNGGASAKYTPGVVPLPASSLLFGTALLGAGAFMRRRKRRS